MQSVMRGFAIVAAIAMVGAVQAADGGDKPADMSKPVQVFILMGQSNMVGMGKIAGGEKSLENAVKNKGKYGYLVDAAGAWVPRQDVRFTRTMQGKGVMVNDATVVTADVAADNGVIHVIDKVILPPM